MKKLLITFLLLNLVACNRATEESDSASQADVVNKETVPKIVAWLTLDNPNRGESRLLSGQISPAELAKLSFESSGKIKNISVKLGDTFRQGQTLATLDTTNYRLQLRQAKAAYATAIANRDQARKEVKRFERLVQAKAASAIQLDGYRLQYRTAQEAINNAQAQIELAEKQLQDTTLIAPFDGVVTAQFGEIGQLASPQSPIFSVETNGLPEVSLAVPENMIAFIQPQQKVIVRIPSQPVIGLVSARVSEIATQATYGAFPVKLVIDNAPSAIKPGMAAEVELSLPQTLGGFRIPPSALGADEGNKHFVYRIIRDALQDREVLKLEKIPVTVESLSEETIAIRGKLQKGDKLVRSGWSFLTPNQVVSLIGEGVRTVNP